MSNWTLIDPSGHAWQAATAAECCDEKKRVAIGAKTAIGRTFDALLISMPADRKKEYRAAHFDEIMGNLHNCLDMSSGYMDLSRDELVNRLSTIRVNFSMLEVLLGDGGNE